MWKIERCREAPPSQLRSKINGADGCLSPSHMVAGQGVDLGGLRFGFHERWRPCLARLDSVWVVVPGYRLC